MKVFYKLKSIIITSIFFIVFAGSSYGVKADQLQTYEEIYTGLMNLQDEIKVTDTSLDFDNIFNIYRKVLDEHPEIFYIGNGVSASSGSNGMFIEPSYQYDKSKIPSMVKIFNDKVNNILNTTIRADMSDLRKELEINDYIVENTYYDWVSHNAYEALVNGRAVCDGYAKAAKHLLDKAGIKNIIITGTADNGSGSGKVGHAWNLVNIGGNYYHLDTTWNDPLYSPAERSYEYFNLSDDIMAKNHFWGASAYPKTTDTKYDFLKNIYSDLEGKSWVTYSIRRDEQLYYQNRAIGSLDLINFDGSNHKKIVGESFDQIRSFVLYKDFIYFTSYSSELLSKYNSSTITYILNRVKLDGSERKIAANWSVIDISLEDNYLNWEGYNEKGKINLSWELTCEKVDLNKDGMNDIRDIAMAAKEYNNKTTNNPAIESYDINSDEVIDLYDLTLLAKYANGWFYRVF